MFKWIGNMIFKKIRKENQELRARIEILSCDVLRHFYDSEGKRLWGHVVHEWVRGYQGSLQRLIDAAVVREQEIEFAYKIRNAEKTLRETEKKQKK